MTIQFYNFVNKCNEYIKNNDNIKIWFEFKNNKFYSTFNYSIYSNNKSLLTFRFKHFGTKIKIKQFNYITKNKYDVYNYIITYNGKYINVSKSSIIVKDEEIIKLKTNEKPICYKIVNNQIVSKNNKCLKNLNISKEDIENDLMDEKLIFKNDKLISFNNINFIIDNDNCIKQMTNNINIVYDNFKIKYISTNNGLLLNYYENNNLLNCQIINLKKMILDLDKRSEQSNNNQFFDYTFKTIHLK